MKKTTKILIAFMFIFLILSFMVWADGLDNIPVPISPGSDLGVARVEHSCPTFSWSGVEGATAYRVAIFEADTTEVQEYRDMEAMASPLMIKEIKGPALSWTPSAEEGLRTGVEYVWYVAAIDVYGNVQGSWSNGKIFKVEIPDRFAGIEEKLREKLREQGLSDESINGVFTEVRSEVKDVEINESEKKGNNDLSVVLGSESHGVGNVIYGSGAGASLVITGGTTLEGEWNSFFGYEAGNATTSGDCNTFSGYQAGYSNTTGTYNTFSGYWAGYFNTTGYSNTFLGWKAGNKTTTGIRNTFLGYEAGQMNTIGTNNTALGAGAGHEITTGYQNTFLGYAAGQFTTTGHSNTFSGFEAGYSNSTGNSNVFLGYQSGYNETGSNKLYIDNFNTSSPLIYGEFDNNLIKINGDFRVTGSFSLDNGTTTISSTELNLLDGKTSVSTGTSNNDKLVTQGYVDDNSGGLTGSALTDNYISKWDNSNTRLINSLISESSTNISINGSLSLNNNTLSLNNGTNTISSTELNLLDGKTLATGAANNDMLVTKGYVDENDDVGVGLTGSYMTDHFICKWDDGGTRLVDSLISESSGVIGINGKLGVGTTSPGADIEISKSGVATLKITNTDGATFKLTAGLNNVQIGAITNHGIKYVAGGSWKMLLNANGNLYMSDGGSYDGTWNNASSRELKENIESISSNEAFDTLENLEPVKFNYKKDQDELHAGFIAEDVPELVATNSRKNLSTMDIVAVLTKVVKEQQSKITELQYDKNRLEKLINDLIKRIDKIESK